MSEVPELWRDETRNCSRPHTVLSHVSPFHALLNVCKVSVIQINSDSFVRHRVGRGWDFSCGAWTANSRLSQVYFQTFLSLSKTCCMFRLSGKKKPKDLSEGYSCDWRCLCSYVYRVHRLTERRMLDFLRVQECFFVVIASRLVASKNNSKCRSRS